MKYLKTYDKMLNFDLDENNQSLILINAIKRNNIDLIKKLFESGLDPNINDFDYHRPIFLSVLEQTTINIDIVKLFIEYGVNIYNDFYGELSIFHFLTGVLLHRNIKQDLYIKLLSIFLDAGANLMIEDKYLKENYLETIVRLLKDSRITQKLAYKIFETIKEKAPDQYEKYIIKKKAEKYNI